MTLLKVVSTASAKSLNYSVFMNHLFTNYYAKNVNVVTLLRFLTGEALTQS